MKKVALILIFIALGGIHASMAQSIIIGSKAPEIKPTAWLNNNKAQSADLTYVEFFVANDNASTASLDRLQELSVAMGNSIQIIVVAKGKTEDISSKLKGYLSPQIAVAIDPEGAIFKSYGVSYLPFGVLLDDKHRSLWLGNSNLLTESQINKIIN